HRQVAAHEHREVQDAVGPDGAGPRGMPRVASGWRSRIGEAAGEGEAPSTVERPVAPQVALLEVVQVRAVIDDVRIAARLCTAGRRDALEGAHRPHTGAADGGIRLPGPPVVVAPGDLRAA